MYSYIGKFSGSGSKNSFYKLKGKRYGFKGFPNKSLAEFSRTVQSDLSTMVFAPKVYSPVCKIRVPHYFLGPNHKPITKMVLSDWGYLTEIAKPYACETGDCAGDCAYDNDCANNEEINDLLEAVSYHFNIEYTDCHADNIGYVKRGSKNVLVLIDLGRESVGDISETDYSEPCWDGDEESDCYCTNCRKKHNYA
jgi:hypothetical protein